MSAEEAFPNQLDVLLNEQGHQVEVLNAARAGHGISGNTSALQAMSSTWQADVAVLYQMTLDLNRLAGLYMSVGKSPEQLRPTEDLAEANAPKDSELAKLAEETTSYQLLKGNLTPRVTQQRLLADELPASAVAEFQRLVNEFIDAAEQSALIPVLCTFATSHDRRQLGSIPSQARASIFRHNTHLTLEGWFSTMESLNEALRAIALERGVRLIDVNAELSGSSDLFRDFVHFNVRGHRAMAEVIAAGVSDLTASPETHISETAARR